MMAKSLSTLSATSALLSSTIRRSQGEMARLQGEVASGRRTDVGLQIGSASATLVSFHQEVSVLKTAIDANNQIAGRLAASQDALSSIVSNAQAALKSAVSARGNPQAREVAAKEARGALQSFIEAANTSYGGVYIFGGLNTQTAPFEDYFATPEPASRVSFEAAFSGAFGFEIDDPAAQTVSVSSMQAFLDSDFASLFGDAGWESNWTSATPQGTTSRISMRQTATASVSAHAEAFRKIASSLVMVAELGSASVNDAAFDAVADLAATGLSEGIALMGGLQSGLGVMQEQTTDATSVMSRRLDLANEEVSRTEQVDLAELSVRLNTLMNQLEATYAVTGRLQQLSLLNTI
ncbi:MAG: flagellar hook-associated family protein [Hyphomicrobium sp.]|nr:flagellar hook-associated family protein [Hyphomicrobium sp.]